MRSSSILFASVFFVSIAVTRPAVADTVLLSAVKGKVQARAPDASAYSDAAKGAKLANGTRLKTAPGALATLEYADGSRADVRESTEIIIRASKNPKTRPNGAVLFFGRVWAKVTKAAGNDRSFEVRSANAVAGVRGTEFEVGVGLNGAAVVRVGEGRVAVSGDDGEADVDGGYTVVSSDRGQLGKRRRSRANFRWARWMTRHAKKMEKKGLAVARSLDGRLNRRKAKVEKLLAKQRKLRKRIEALGEAKKRGEPVGQQMAQALAEMKKIGRRIEDMRARLEGAFGLFAKWGEVAKKGQMNDAGQIAGMSKSIAAIAADFADMIEEGTDLSEDGMHDMMDDMGKGKMMGPGDSAADELFK